MNTPKNAPYKVEQRRIQAERRRVRVSILQAHPKLYKAIRHRNGSITIVRRWG